MNTNVGLKKTVEGPISYRGSAMPCCSMADPSLRSWTRVDKASLVFDAIRQLGRTSRDLRHLIFTVRVKDVLGQGVELLDLEQAAPDAAVGAQVEMLTRAVRLVQNLFSRAPRAVDHQRAARHARRFVTRKIQCRRRHHWIANSRPAMLRFK